MATGQSPQLNRPFIFVSCGQYTEEEKRLGRQIAQMTKTLTGFDAFYAENVQDLNGLETNILSALRGCAALIVVLHPRGTIERPDDSPVVRASVWIEQEIAIATYIQRVERRPLPIIAFKHVTVGREGLRYLLQLNPIEFTHESEVLAHLPKRLKEWRDLPRWNHADPVLLADVISELEDNLHRAKMPRIGDTYQRPSSEAWKRNRNRLNLSESLRSDLDLAYRQIDSWQNIVDSDVHPNYGSPALDFGTSDLAVRSLPNLIEALKKLLAGGTAVSP
jgi:hypothetical protein